MSQKIITRSTVCTFLFVLFFQSSFSQENYLSGYVINLNKDTIHGFIDYRNWGYNPDNVRFKKAMDSEPITYTISDIIEFGVQDEIYVSAIVNTEVSSTQIDKLQEDPSFQIIVDTTFLQTLYKGNKSLYYYHNQDGKDNFYVRSDTAFELLLYKKYINRPAGAPVTIQNKRYIGQLVLYLNDCMSINTKLTITEYNKRDLERLFQFYYECTESADYFKKKHEKLMVEPGILAGVSSSSIRFNGSNFAYLEEADFSRSTNFSAGLFLNFILLRNQRKWSIKNELIFASYTVKGYAEVADSRGGYSKTNSEIGFSQIKVNNLLAFNYPIGNTWLFLNAGISNSFAISEKNFKTDVWVFNGFESVNEGKALDDPRKYEQGIVLGLGLKYHKFSLEIRYETGNGISNISSLISSTNRYYVLAGYRLN